jgi:hypothetical protein
LADFGQLGDASMTNNPERENGSHLALAFFGRQVFDGSSRMRRHARHHYQGKEET